MDDILSKIKICKEEDYNGDTIHEGRKKIYLTINKLLNKYPELKLKDGRFNHMGGCGGEYKLTCIFNTKINDKDEDIYIHWSHNYSSEDEFNEDDKMNLDYDHRMTIINGIKQKNIWYLLDTKKRCESEATYFLYDLDDNSKFIIDNPKWQSIL